jgi:hypothetical protein
VFATANGIGCDHEKLLCSRTSTTKGGASSPTRPPPIGSPTQASRTSEDQLLRKRSYRPASCGKDAFGHRVGLPVPVRGRPWSDGSRPTRCHRRARDLRGDVFGDLPGVFLGLERSRDGYIPEAGDGFALCSRPMRAVISGSSYFSHQPRWRASQASLINSAVVSESTSIPCTDPGHHVTAPASVCVLAADLGRERSSSWRYF